jgi:hypothetical protein
MSLPSLPSLPNNDRDRDHDYIRHVRHATLVQPHHADPSAEECVSAIAFAVEDIAYGVWRLAKAMWAACCFNPSNFLYLFGLLFVVCVLSGATI